MSDQTSFTVVFACGEGAAPSVGESGNDFSEYRVIAIANGDYTERLNDAENQLADARAENERLKNTYAICGGCGHQNVYDKFGGHSPWCNSQIHMECDCGLRAALEGGEDG